MNIIWANRLIAGTKTWAEMPISPPRWLSRRFWPSAWTSGEITADDYKNITGDDYAA